MALPKFQWKLWLRKTNNIEHQYFFFFFLILEQPVKTITVHQY